MRWRKCLTITYNFKTQASESTVTINLNKLLNSIKNDFKNDNINFNDNKLNIELKGRPTALKRSFENIIQNGLTYGKRVNKRRKKEIIEH